MKKTFRATIQTMIIASIFLTSCSSNGGGGILPPPQPVANFSYSGAGVAPVTVSFSNTSTNASSYSWDFGDNTTSTSFNPTHTYTQGGVYSVRLTANGTGGSNSVTKTVNIQTPTSVRITSIKLLGMPFTDGSGAGWDNNTGPDVYCEFLNASNTVLLTGATFNNVISVPPNLVWTVTPSYQVTNFAATYKINIWDEDVNDFPPNPDDFIGGYVFNFGIYANAGYPTTATIQIAGNPLIIQLSLQWQ
jgi:PKD repeat protein